MNLQSPSLPCASFSCVSPSSALQTDLALSRPLCRLRLFRVRLRVMFFGRLALTLQSPSLSCASPASTWSAYVWLLLCTQFPDVWRLVLKIDNVRKPRSTLTSLLHMDNGIYGARERGSSVPRSRNFCCRKSRSVLLLGTGYRDAKSLSEVKIHE